MIRKSTKSLMFYCKSLYFRRNFSVHYGREKEREGGRERCVFQSVLWGGKNALEYQSPIFDQQDQDKSQQGLLHANYVMVPICIQKLPLLKRLIGYRSKALG